MFSKIKKQIKELAKNAVIAAEKELGSGRGKEKKQMAVNYVIEHLPFSEFVKNIIGILLSSFIDDAVEIAVNYLSKTEGE